MASRPQAVPDTERAARHVVILGTADDPSEALGPRSQPLAPPPPGAPRRRSAARRWATGHLLPAPPLVADPPPGPVPGHLRRRRRRPPWPIPVMAVAAMSLALLLQLERPVAAPALSAGGVPAPSTVAGAPPTLPWPAVGEAAVSVPQAGVLLASGAEPAVPVASLTKVMTAYLVLRDHPLGAEEQGPSLLMTAADQADSAANAHANDTSIPVVAGQQFSERQLLDALIVHSANDVADTLARWDAGTMAAFVAKMNAAAAGLGMRQTHYVDPSGIDQADVSTPADQLRLTAAAMAMPAFAAVADQPTITVPGAGLLSNYVPAVGTDGVVGVKSGFTQAAMGCVILAAERQVAGGQVLVLAALTGQQTGRDPIPAADRAAIALIDAAAGALQPVTPLAGPVVVGHVSAPWSSVPVAARTTRGLAALAWPGDRVAFRLRTGTVPDTVHPGQRLATLVVSVGTRTFAVPVVATGRISPPSVGWRFRHR